MLGLPVLVRMGLAGVGGVEVGVEVDVENGVMCSRVVGGICGSAGTRFDSLLSCLGMDSGCFGFVYKMDQFGCYMHLDMCFVSVAAYRLLT